MTFDQVLSELLSLTGTHIEVAVACREKHPDVALAASGTLLSGTELNGAAPGSAFERFHFAFGDDPRSGFLLDRSSFARANRWGDELRIECRGLIFSIRQARADALA